MPLRPAAGEHVLDGRVDEGIEARAGRLRTLLDELGANVNPPTVDLQRSTWTCSGTCESHTFMKELRAARR